MNTVSMVLILLIAIAASSIITRMLPVTVPKPVIQIAIGIVLGLNFELQVKIDPEVFLLLFLPPLLFLDAWHIPKDELRRNLFTIVELALGLVILSVIGVGVFIHWMIPAVPLAVAFALAAAVSPTDPIAVSSIASFTGTPRRMLRILEGEALLNDASGLVCLQFAVVAVLTGVFSPLDAILAFVWLVSGGLAVGALVALVVPRMVAWVETRYGNDLAANTLVSILIPFVAYILAEHIHGSGLLAAVAAGLTMNLAESSQRTQTAIRPDRHAIWNIIHFALNGAIFVLLGEQLPLIMKLSGPVAHITGHTSAWWLAIYVLAIVVVLTILRFIWVWTSLHWAIIRHPELHPFNRPPWRLVAAVSVAGVRGAVTLAGVLSIPFMLVDGTPFPARGVVIFLAAGVVIVSLAFASILLPWLLRGLNLHDLSELATKQNVR